MSEFCYICAKFSKMIRKQLSLLAALALSFQLANAQDLPKPSPMGTVTQIVGLTKVSIEYSRPGVKERTIWGDLVPYDKVWRTGANKATQFSISTDVKIGDKELKAGDYAIFTIPTEKDWTIIFSSNTEQWGTGSYKEEEDALRVTATPSSGDMIERMQFTIENVTDNGADVILGWEKMRVGFSISVDPAEQAMKNIEAEIKKVDASWRTYNNAARYYVDNDKDVAKALEWSTKSYNMEKRYWTTYTHAIALAANKKYKEATAVAEESLKLAEEAESKKYIKLNTENIAKWKKMK